LRRIGLAGAASAQLVDGVVPLRPEEAMVEAMMRGWRAQQAARGLRERTIGARERLVRRFLAFSNELPWQWSPAHVDEWTLTLTAEHHLAPATVRGYQTELRLFSEYLTDARYGWAAACEEAFGTFPVPICHEWNTIAHLNEYEAVRRPGRSPGRRCNASWTMPTIRSTAPRGQGGRGRWPPTGMPRCSR
jgi:integrase/recombinase XerC